MGVFDALKAVGIDSNVFIIIIVIFTSTFLMLKITRRRRYKLPPGPRGYPLIGNILDLKSKPRALLFEDWKRIYGPVMSVYFGPKLTIVLNNYEVALEAFVKKQAAFSGRPSGVVIDMLSGKGKDIIFGEGPTWKLHRKIAVTAIRKFLNSTAFEAQTLDIIKYICGVLMEEKGPVVPNDYLVMITINIACAIAFGHSYDPADEEFQEVMEKSKALVNTEGGIFLEELIPLLRYWPTEKFKRLQNVNAWMSKLAQRKLQKSRETIVDDHIRSLADALIVARQETEKEGNEEFLSRITDTHMVYTLLNVFSAGIDTTRITIDFALKHMAASPEVQTKVQEEIDKAMGADRFPTVKDRTLLPYTQAVLHEVMRLHPPVPTNVPHKTTCDCVVGGYDIPKGTMVFMNIWGIHHDEKYWQDANLFKPERFLDADGQFIHRADSWLAFSAGSRSCLGEVLAKQEVFLVFASLMQQFSVRFPENDSPSMEDEFTFVLLCAKTYRLVFEKR